MRPLAEIPFVTFTCAKDVHYAKALLGSVAHFYPANQIFVVAEENVPERDAQQMGAFPNVRVFRVPHLIAAHKLNLTGLLAKFNVLFLPGVKQALVADADSVLVDCVLDRVDQSKMFEAFHGRKIALEENDERASFERWAVDIASVRNFHPAFGERGLFYVQGSHFYINIERFPFPFFYEALKLMSYDHKSLTPLRAGDQGFWNYLLNCGRLAETDFDLKPCTIQVGQTARVAVCEDIGWVEAREGKEWSFVHYVGFSRRYLRRGHDYAQALQWATGKYYQALAPGTFLRDEICRFLRKSLRLARCRLHWETRDRAPAS